MTIVSGDLADPSPLAPVERAKAFLSECAAIWGLTNLEHELVLDGSKTKLVPDEDGECYVRFRQAVSGVPLPHHGLLVIVLADGRVTSVSGGIEATALRAEIDSRPRLTRADAIRAVERHMGLPLLGEPIAELCAVPTREGVRLAWVMGAVSASGPIGREYSVDALDGRVLSALDRVQTDHPGAYFEREHSDGGARFKMRVFRDPLDFVLRDPRGDEAFVCPMATYDSHGYTIYHIMAESRATPVTHPYRDLIAALYLCRDRDGGFLDPLQAHEIGTHRTMRRVVAYWKSALGRDGWDGAGGGVENFVHANFALPGRPADPNNAASVFLPYTVAGVRVAPFFIGDGDGLHLRSLFSLNTLGHEFGHAVVNSIGTLENSGMSGAIHEHLGDAFGTFVEHYYHAGLGQFDWRIGEEDLTIQDGVSCVRNMADPPSTRQGTRVSVLPDTMDGYQVLPADTDHDNGGVHTNCTILDKWLYLWVQGGEGRARFMGGFRVSCRGMIGYGIDRYVAFRFAENAYYEMIQRLPRPASSFLDFRRAMLDAIDVVSRRRQFAMFSALPRELAIEAFDGIGLK